MSSFCCLLETAETGRLSASCRLWYMACGLSHPVMPVHVSVMSHLSWFRFTSSQDSNVQQSGPNYILNASFSTAYSFYFALNLKSYYCDHGMLEGRHFALFPSCHGLGENQSSCKLCRVTIGTETLLSKSFGMPFSLGLHHQGKRLNAPTTT